MTATSETTADDIRAPDALLVLGATAGLVLGHLDAASAVPPGTGQLPDRFRDFPPYQS